MKETGAGEPERAERETAAELHDAERGAVITPYPDGPLIVRGRFVITAGDGQPVPAGRRTVALCRCGQSASKPFCDGSHARTGFRARAHVPAGSPAGARAAEGRSSEDRPARQHDSR
jgi:CDGSH-type Zn-finger protein